MSEVMDDEKIYQNYETRVLTIGEILEMYRMRNEEQGG